jgi:integrase/recombinase XerD
MNKDRISAKRIARKISKLLKTQHPDALYVKTVFKYIRVELDIVGKEKKPKKLPELLTEEEMNRFYNCVWNCGKPSHMVMIKLLLYTGIRNSELINLRISNVDLNSLKIRIENGKGGKDRYVLIPKSFRGELALYISSQRNKKAEYLFETNRRTKMTSRWFREILTRYAKKSGIEKRIYPHLFRHQLLTYLTQKGLIDSKIQLISGHSDRKSLSIYQDLSLSDVADEYQNVMKDFPVQ